MLYRVPNTLYIWKLSVHFCMTAISSVASTLHPIPLSNAFTQHTLHINARSKTNCQTRVFPESSRVRVLVLFCTVLLHSSTGDRTHLLCITCPCKNHYRNTICKIFTAPGTFIEAMQVSNHLKSTWCSL